MRSASALPKLSKALARLVMAFFASRLLLIVPTNGNAVALTFVPGTSSGMALDLSLDLEALGLLGRYRLCHGTIFCARHFRPRSFVPGTSVPGVWVISAYVAFATRPTGAGERDHSVPADRPAVVFVPEALFFVPGT